MIMNRLHFLGFLSSRGESLLNVNVFQHMWSMLPSPHWSLTGKASFSPPLSPLTDVAGSSLGTVQTRGCILTSHYVAPSRAKLHTEPKQAFPVTILHQLVTGSSGTRNPMVPWTRSVSWLHSGSLSGCQGVSLSPVPYLRPSSRRDQQR